MTKKHNSQVKICTNCRAPFTRNTTGKYCLTCVPLRGPGESSSRWTQSIRLYGIDKFQYDAMYFEQDGQCAICKGREASCVDHDHATGKARGLLCRSCNTMLGFIETPGRLRATLDYAANFDTNGFDW